MSELRNRQEAWSETSHTVSCYQTIQTDGGATQIGSKYASQTKLVSGIN